VRFVYRHMAFLGEESVWAAAAAECADEQGQFWQYHDVLFTHTAGRGQGVFTLANLKRYAADLRLNSGAFNSCLDTGRYDSWVRAQTEVGRDKGVTSTPTLIVNGRLISPVPGFEDLRTLIQANNSASR
jgi:protein-disulfide isomerase